MNEDISLTEVSKVFRMHFSKRKVAVDKVSFGVTRGEIVGLLGPNGSGKSTTLKMILGFLKPTHGEILVCGHSPLELESRRQIGYLPENPRFQKFLTGEEVLRYYGGLLGLSKTTLTLRIEELLILVGLRSAAKEKIQGYSKGMSQRLAIAQALLHRPRILIFDEPMSGLDPMGRKDIRELISRIHEEMPQSTMFFSTHILSDVERVCSSVILLKQGKLVQQSTLNELLSSVGSHFEITIQNPNRDLIERFRDQGFRESQGCLIFTVNGVRPLIDELEKLENAGISVASVYSQTKSLEEALFGTQREAQA